MTDDATDRDDHAEDSGAGNARFAPLVAYLTVATVAVVNTHIHIVCPRLRAVLAVCCLVEALCLSRWRPSPSGRIPIADRWGGLLGFLALIWVSFLIGLAVLKLAALVTNAIFNREFSCVETRSVELGFGRTEVTSWFDPDAETESGTIAVVTLRYHLFNVVGFEYVVHAAE